MSRSAPWRRALVILAAIASGGLTAPLAATCSGDAVAVADLAPTALLSGPLHRLAPCARIVGHMARFELDTPYGRVAADSFELLALRVDELGALELLHDQARTGVALDAALQRGADTATGVARVLGSPVDTLSGAPDGARRFFQRRLRKYGARAQRLGARITDAATDRDAAYATVSARPGVVAPATPDRPWWRSAAREAGRYVRGELGYGSTRRRLAQQLRVDPYSSNPLLRARLDQLAWAALAGGQAADLALAALAGPATSVLARSRQLNDWVWELAPADVAERNRQRLAALRCGGVELDRFLRNGAFSPTLQTALADALVELQPTAGCIDVVELAAAVDGEIEARYLVRALELLVAWHAEHAGVAALDLAGTAPILRPGPDRLVLPLAVDRLQWDRATRGYFAGVRLRSAEKTALIAGDAEPRARRGLTRRGWSIVERAPHGPGTAGCAPDCTR